MTGVNKVLRALLVLRVIEASGDLRAKKVSKVLKKREAKKDFLVLLVNKVNKVLKVLQVNKEFLVLRVTKEI